MSEKQYKINRRKICLENCPELITDFHVQMCKIYSVIQLSSSFRRLFNKDNTEAPLIFNISCISIPVFMGLGMYGENTYNTIKYNT